MISMRAHPSTLELLKGLQCFPDLCKHHYREIGELITASEFKLPAQIRNPTAPVGINVR